MKLTFNELRGPGVATELRGTDDEKLNQAKAAFDRLIANSWAQQTAAMLDDGLTQEQIDDAWEFFADLHAENRSVLAELAGFIIEPRNEKD